MVQENKPLMHFRVLQHNVDDAQRHVKPSAAYRCSDFR
jgi:hypothetical protein